MMEIAAEIDSYLYRLFSICRSITGPGNRETLRVLQELVPVQIKEYPSGTEVYDWIIPDEWRIRDAWIKGEDEKKIVDFQECNVHLVSYSEPVHGRFSFEELEERLHFHEELPEAIPYCTSYYRRDWGFCVNQAQLQQLRQTEEQLEVLVDSDLDPSGSLTVGELVIPGRSEKEILISTYICHPSLANDNLSGVVMTAFLARELLKRELQWSYRFIWVPETIGAIAYCAMNEEAMRKIDVGLVVTTVGGPGALGYKQSWQKEHYINRLIDDALCESGKQFNVYPFDIHGSDERQFSSQGFRINMATICKDRYYEYPQYHTSLDDLSFMNGRQIEETLRIYLEVIDKLERRHVYQNTVPNCEVMLSRHDLYPKRGGMFRPVVDGYTELDLTMWVLFYCDGKVSVPEVADLLGVEDDLIEGVCQALETKGIMVRV